MKRLALALILAACNQREKPRQRPPDVVVMKAPSPPPRRDVDPQACPAIIVTLAQDGASVGDGATARAIAPCGGSLDHTAITIELCAAIKARACDGQLILRVDSGIVHGEVVALMELAKDAGVTKLAIGTGATPLSTATPIPARCDEPTPASCP